MYGIPHAGLRPQYFDEETSFTEDTTAAFVDLATDFVKQSQKSWLDVTGHGLDLLHFGTWPLAPTVVLVRSVVADLVLFWNLRTATD